MNKKESIFEALSCSANFFLPKAIKNSVSRSKKMFDTFQIPSPLECHVLFQWPSKLNSTQLKKKIYSLTIGRFTHFDPFELKNLWSTKFSKKIN
jgi:hypothetical protein